MKPDDRWERWKRKCQLGYLIVQAVTTASAAAELALHLYSIIG